MEDFAEEPFAGVSAAAFGEVLRADFPGQRGDFRRFRHAGVVLPQPGHGRRVLAQIAGQRPAAGRRPSTGNGVLPVVSTPMPTIWSGLKPRTLFRAAASACWMVISAPLT